MVNVDEAAPGQHHEFLARIRVLEERIAERQPGRDKVDQRALTVPDYF